MIAAFKSRPQAPLVKPYLHCILPVSTYLHTCDPAQWTPVSYQYRHFEVRTTLSKSSLILPYDASSDWIKTKNISRFLLARTVLDWTVLSTFFIQRKINKTLYQASGGSPLLFALCLVSGAMDTPLSRRVESVFRSSSSESEGSESALALRSSGVRRGRTHRDEVP